MAERGTHRGAGPGDRERFGARSLPGLRAAATDLCWLLTRGYGSRAALKLAGDHFQLDVRQRAALMRAACSDEAVTRRLARRVEPSAVRGAEVWLDGFNVLTTVEAALGGAVVLAARDSSFRDLLGLHGSYRTVAETGQAIGLVGAALEELHVGRCVWLLDSPVSNSGKLGAAIAALARGRGRDWEVRLEQSPDRLLRETDHVVATADGAILDACSGWLNLAREVITARVRSAWILELFPETTDETVLEPER